MKHRHAFHTAALLVGCWLLVVSGCTPVASPPAPPQSLTPVRVRERPLHAPAACTGAFVAHELDHITTTADGIVRMFAANGAGLAVNDLDNDGDLDLVLGSEAGPNSILWNEGDLQFHKTTFGRGPTRALTVIDVDQDGKRDLVLTLNTGALNYWRNRGGGEFVQQVLPGVVYPAYALNWGDLDGDGDLDLVTASYDAGTLTDTGNTFLLGSGGGVVVYENKAGHFSPIRLATAAQGLALALVDLNADGRKDIYVGNDFAMMDAVWLRSDNGWTAAQPFDQTSQSTMSIDWADLANDGSLALFTTDMNPYDIAPAKLAAWLPVMATLEEANAPDDPQRMANALLLPARGQRWQNQAVRRGVEATGWSWSGRFGDLDNDGLLDLYVVNGMIEERMFGHLPKHELVEENQALRNVGNGDFVPMPAWQLNSTRSGRSMVMADLDEDGDLDIIVNNLRAPAVLYENQICNGAGVEVALRWPASANLDAIGARLTLQTSSGVSTRDVRAASGYLSADAPIVHFGVPAAASLQGLTIRWPDGALSQVEDVAPGMILLVER